MPMVYEVGSVVWAKLGQNWWPGRVCSLEDCPELDIEDQKKKPFAVVKFFNETGIHEVTREDLICSYNCSRKEVYIKKGIRSMQSDSTLKEKFEADITMAEKLTGGNTDIIKEIMSNTDNQKRKIDYSELGFGVRKPKRNISKDQVVQRVGFSNIGEAIQYKRGATPKVIKVIEYNSKIMEQPKNQSIEEEMKKCGSFKCHTCGFCCNRVNVMIWHNKSHIQKVADYSSGLSLPKKRKRKSKNKVKQSSSSQGSSTHKKLNGHVPELEQSLNASQLLQDWDDDFDDDIEAPQQSADKKVLRKSPSQSESLPNGGEYSNAETSSSRDRRTSESREDDSDDEGDYYTRLNDRKPMPKPVDINSAFDALLAESSPLNSYTSKSTASNSFVNNFSDSDDSDWEKYFTKSQSNNNTSVELSPHSSSMMSEGRTSSHRKSSHGSSRRKSSSKERNVKSSSSLSRKTQESVRSDSPGPSISKRSSPIPDRDSKDIAADGPSTQSSSSSTSSGPAYMLVAVDAQGNNVPMPVLSEGGNHLVAVEASMEDGSTRTLYIDPAHLGPNVDLNNLMLHIDNSGQETVIIPTSSSSEMDVVTTISSALPDVSSQFSGSDCLKTDGLCSASNDNNEEINERSSVFSSVAKTESEGICFDKDSPSKCDSNLSENEEVCTFIGRDCRSKEEANSSLSENDLDTTDSTDDSEMRSFFVPVNRCDMFSCDEVVWVETHGLLWPSYIVDIFKEEGVATIFYINCQQQTPIKVKLDRIKIFSHFDYLKIYKSQDGKAAGLTDAMIVANKFVTSKKEKKIDITSKIFFSKSIETQKSLLNKIYMKQSKSALQNSSRSSLNKTQILKSEEISMDSLSLRDKLKLASATKSREKFNERFVRYIKSDECWKYLRKIMTGRISSSRHDFFMENFCKVKFTSIMTQVFNSGCDFFSQGESEQLEDLILWLSSKCKEKLPSKFRFNSYHVCLYANTVLLPEAIKQSLRVLKKLSEDELEPALMSCPSESKTERKAKKILF